MNKQFYNWIISEWKQKGEPSAWCPGTERGKLTHYWRLWVIEHHYNIILSRN